MPKENEATKVHHIQVTIKASHNVKGYDLFFSADGVEILGDKVKLFCTHEQFDTMCEIYMLTKERVIN